MNGRLRVSAAEGAREAVFAGLGLSIGGSEWMFTPELKSGAVKVVLADWSLPPGELWAGFQPGAKPVPKRDLLRGSWSGSFRKKPGNEECSPDHLQNPPNTMLNEWQLRGHEERFPPPRLNAGYGFRKETIVGTRSNGLPTTLVPERQGATEAGSSRILHADPSGARKAVSALGLVRVRGFIRRAFGKPSVEGDDPQAPFRRSEHDNTASGRSLSDPPFRALLGRARGAVPPSALGLLQNRKPRGIGSCFLLGHYDDLATFRVNKSTLRSNAVIRPLTPSR